MHRTYTMRMRIAKYGWEARGLGIKGDVSGLESLQLL